MTWILKTQSSTQYFDDTDIIKAQSIYDDLQENNIPVFLTMLPTKAAENDNMFYFVVNTDPSAWELVGNIIYGSKESCLASYGLDDSNKYGYHIIEKDAISIHFYWNWKDLNYYRTKILNELSMREPVSNE